MSGALRPCLWWIGVLVVGLLGGCGSKSINHAPVEDRGPTAARPVVAQAPEVKPLPGAENAGKPGYYTVKQGDTLIRIGLDAGQSYKDISRWNSLENPNRIEVGQVLRVLPPGATESGVVARPVTTSSVSPTPIAAGAPAKAASASAAAAPGAAASTPVAGDDLPWIWPGNGQILNGFDEVKNKGVDIGGAAGDAVLAAADGRVVYAGAGLRGYGNLIILKHNTSYLSAYAHNQALLVKEDQVVKRGQKIAEMGNSDADRVKLHFEVRKQGKPVDPAKYLPAR